MGLTQNITVVIPIYNAAEFLIKAVESALIQPEVGEILLIEDASKDESLKICKSLADSHQVIRLLTHPGNVNKGAGESRNLGIKNAKYDFIAFLDADDYFLPGRFLAEHEIFNSQHEVDGVYGAMGYHYYSEEGKRKYKEIGYPDLSTIPDKIPPSELFFSLMYLHNKANGQFHLNTLTVRKSSLLNKTELFNNYEMHEDTAFLIQLSLNCQIVSGIIDKPIAMYGVHDSNRIINNTRKSGSQVLYYKFLYDWSLHAPNGSSFSKLFQAFLMSEKLQVSKKFVGTFKLIWYCISNKILLRKGILFYPAAKHVLGTRIGPYILNYKERIQRSLFKSDPYSSFMDEFYKK